MNTSALRLPLVTLVVVMVALAAGIGLVMANTNYDWQGAILVLAGLGVLAVFLIPRLARLEINSSLIKVLAAGLLAKICFAFIRYGFAFGVYGGTADAGTYSEAGTKIAQYIHALNFASIASYMNFGTNFLELFTGIVYVITGPSIYAGFIVFAFLSFLGSYYFYRAFEVAFPKGNTQLFLILIFFFPSLLYWPNGIGKDALISLFLGLFAYGTARFVRNQMKGLVPLVLGILGILCVRPHIAMVLIFVLGLVLLTLIFQKSTSKKYVYILCLMGIVVSAWLLMPIVGTYIRAGGLSFQSIITSFQDTQDFTFEGGSAYQVVDITNPIQFPLTLLTLMFRPFPWQAHNLQALVQALEGFVLIGLTLWRIKSIGRALIDVKSDAYLCYIWLSIIGVLIGLTSIANYGILVRERAMILPFLLMLLAYDGRAAVPAPSKLIPERSVPVEQRP